MGRGFQRQQGGRARQGSKFENEGVLVSFKFLDKRQSDSYKLWVDKGYAAALLERIELINKSPLYLVLEKEYIIKYSRSDFNVQNMRSDSVWDFPRIVPNPDVLWCKIRLGSLLRVIGYFEKEVFYIVFLDSNHRFWPTSA